MAFYNEVTVEKSATGTYFAACGWSRGYFGIQEMPDGRKHVIFSVWDPDAGDDASAVPPTKRVRLLHKDTDVRVGRFGNEGTGGQSFFDYDWELHTTYRFFVNATRDGADRTAYHGYFYMPEENEWKHLATFSTLTPKGELLRDYYSFVEDFQRNNASTKQVRKATFGNGWVKPASGRWVPLEKAEFTADENPRRNIDSGPAGRGFFLATGGTTANATTDLLDTMTRAGRGRWPNDLPEVE